MHARASTLEKVLFSFDDANGARPVAGVNFDRAGNLFGTTFYGGAIGNGTVFELSPGPDGQWTEQVLHSFPTGNDGIDPAAPLTLDAAGNLYGTTEFGGLARGQEGTVFELLRGAGAWTFQTIHAFDGPGGYKPLSGVLMDSSAKLYGTTPVGGTYHEGAIFKLRRTSGGQWVVRRLHSFSKHGNDGKRPVAGLIFDGLGNLYGTASSGGASNHGAGLVFELQRSSGREDVLYRFQGAPGDGADPTTWADV